MNGFLKKLEALGIVVLIGFSVFTLEACGRKNPDPTPSTPIVTEPTDGPIDNPPIVDEKVDTTKYDEFVGKVATLKNYTVVTTDAKDFYNKYLVVGDKVAFYGNEYDRRGTFYAVEGGKSVVYSYDKKQLYWVKDYYEGNENATYNFDDIILGVAKNVVIESGENNTYTGNYNGVDYEIKVSDTELTFKYDGKTTVVSDVGTTASFDLPTPTVDNTEIKIDPPVVEGDNVYTIASDGTIVFDHEKLAEILLANVDFAKVVGASKDRPMSKIVYVNANNDSIGFLALAEANGKQVMQLFKAGTALMNEIVAGNLADENDFVEYLQQNSKAFSIDGGDALYDYTSETTDSTQLAQWNALTQSIVGEMGFTADQVLFGAKGEMGGIGVGDFGSQTSWHQYFLIEKTDGSVSWYDVNITAGRYGNDAYYYVENNISDKWEISSSKETTVDAENAGLYNVSATAFSYTYTLIEDKELDK